MAIVPCGVNETATRFSISSPATPRWLLRSPFSPFFAPLLSRPPLPTTPLLLRSPWILGPRVGVRVRRILRCADFPSCAVLSSGLCLSFFLRDQAILSIEDLAFRIHAKTLGDRLPTALRNFVRFRVNRFTR